MIRKAPTRPIPASPPVFPVVHSQDTNGVCLFFFHAFPYIRDGCAQARRLFNARMVVAMTLYPDPSQVPNDTVPPGWRRFRPKRDGGKGSFFFWSSVVGLGCLSLACVCWLASNVLAQKGSEKLLRFNLVLPKLKSNHGERRAEAPRTSEPVPSQLAQPKERATPTPVSMPLVVDHPKVTIAEAPPLALYPAATPEPPRFDAGPVMMTRVELPAPAMMCPDPVVYVDPCAPQRGDTPMIRNWKTLTMYSLLTAANIVIAQPIFAQEGKDNTDELKKSIDKLIKRIDALEQKPTDETAIAKAIAAELKKLENGMLTEIKKSIDQTNLDVSAVQTEQQRQKKLLVDQKFLIDLLTGRVDSLEKKLIAGGAPATPAVDKAFMEEFRFTMKSLQDTLAKMGTIERRTMLSPPENGINGAKLSRIMLANHYNSELLFIVNGVGHRLPAQSTKLLENVAPGTLTYEVFSTQFGVLERRTANLVGGDTFNLTAR